jgi:imidazolonepropionase-like amidohydrolase/Tol biopolymer transport system component
MTHRRRLPGPLVFAATSAALVFANAQAGAQASPVPSLSATTRTVDVHDGAADPAVSPDGGRIALSILGRIWLAPISGGDAAELTRGTSWDGAPAWSPDGRFLAWAQTLPAGTDLVVHDLATGTSSVVHHVPGTVPALQYTQDGATLYYVEQRGQYDAHLWRVNVDGSAPKQLTFTHNWHEWAFALSPDAKQVLLTSGRYGGSDLYLLDPSDLSSTRLTTTPAINEAAVAWSADGSRRVFVRTENGVDQLVVQTVDGGAERVVSTSPFDQKQIALTPDGGSVVMVASRKLWRVDLASGATSPIAYTACFDLPAQAPADLVVTHARLWDGTGTAPVSDATFVVRDGKVAAAGAGVTPPAGVPVIDAHGMTLMPGLMDNHYHYWSSFQGPTLLARGITTIRDPGAPVSTSLNFKEAIALGVQPGPHIYTAGPLIDGVGGYHPWVNVEISDSAAAPALVDDLKAQGVDLLKVYFMLEPPVLRSVIREAHKVGLRVTGHIGVRTGLRTAMEGGIDGLNHVRVWRDLPPDHAQPDGSAESLDGTVHPVERMQADWTGIDPDGPDAASLIKLMADSHIGFDPTLSIQRIRDQQRQVFTLEQYSRAQESVKKMGRFVHNAWKAGVMILAGTDDGNLFDEMDDYAAAGLTNEAILKAATVNGATWLGREGTFGTLEAGKRADFILVDGDPLADIRDVRKVQVVVQDGRVVFRK